MCFTVLFPCNQEMKSISCENQTQRDRDERVSLRAICELVYLFVCVCVGVSFRMPDFHSICLCVSVYSCLFLCLFISLSDLSPVRQVVFLCRYLSVSLSVCQSVLTSASPSNCLSMIVFACLLACGSICLIIQLCCLSVYVYICLLPCLSKNLSDYLNVCLCFCHLPFYALDKDEETNVQKRKRRRRRT